MPYFDEHCKKSLDLFGEEGREYHAWLDQYAKYGYHHRKVLHHKEGVEVGVQLFGEDARKHLEQHIRDDRGEDKIPSVHQLRSFGHVEPGLKKRQKTYVIHYEDGITHFEDFR